MRRLLAVGSIAAVVALGAACSDDNGGGEQTPDAADDNTAEVCAEAEQLSASENQRLEQEITTLRQEELPEDEYEQAAMESMEGALLAWSDGLHEQAERADRQELSDALAGLADGLSRVASDLTVEAVRNQQLPGVEELNAFSQTLTELCRTTPATP